PVLDVVDAELREYRARELLDDAELVRGVGIIEAGHLAPVEHRDGLARGLLAELLQRAGQQGRGHQEAPQEGHQVLAVLPQNLEHVRSVTIVERRAAGAPGLSGRTR